MRLLRMADTGRSYEVGHYKEAQRGTPEGHSLRGVEVSSVLTLPAGSGGRLQGDRRDWRALFFGMLGAELAAGGIDLDTA